MKSIVRNNILNELNALPSETKQAHSQAIQHHLQTLLQNESGYWAGYQNLKDEPALQWEQISKQISWVFPRVQGAVLEFKHAALAFSKSGLGVAEPQDGKVVPLAEIKGVVIPALAYDQQGHRLGRGQGFYDRTLESYEGAKIGVCFNLALREQLPHEAHDVQCDQIVTEQQIYQVNQSEGARKWN